MSWGGLGEVEEVGTDFFLGQQRHAKLGLDDLFLIAKSSTHGWSPDGVFMGIWTTINGETAIHNVNIPGVLVSLIPTKWSSLWLGFTAKKHVQYPYNAVLMDFPTWGTWGWSSKWMMICRLFLGLDSVPIFLVESGKGCFFLCDLLWIKSFAPNTRCALRGTPLVYATTVFLVVFLCSAAKLKWSETPPMIIVLMLVISTFANGMVPWTSWTFWTSERSKLRFHQIRLGISPISFPANPLKAEVSIPKSALEWRQVCLAFS